jgi:hypothetical protein
MGIAGIIPQCDALFDFYCFIILTFLCYRGGTIKQKERKKGMKKKVLTRVAAVF